MNPLKTISLSTLLFTGSLFAQQPAGGTVTVNDSKAKTILDEVSKNAKTFKTVKANFTITIENADKTKTVQEGELIVKGQKYKVKMKQKAKDKTGKEKEYAEEYISDTQTAWNYSEKNKEVTIDNAKKTTKEGFSVNDIFVLHEKGFKYSFEKEEKQAGVDVQVINLYPSKPDGKKYHTVRVVIDKVKKQITSVTFLNKDGSKMTYTVKSMTPNTDVPDTTFNFDVKTHPGVEVVDLREGSGE